MWCEAPLDSAWKSVLKGKVVALSEHALVAPMATANDGRSFFSFIHTKAFTGVVKIDAESSRYKTIQRVANPRTDGPAGGRFDGRWLVWTDYHSLSETGNFAVWSWDSRTGKLKQIGATKRPPSGDYWPSAWQTAVALDGYATWEQGSGPNGIGEIHVVDLKSGRERIVRRGHVGGSFLIKGHRVVWPESMKPGALTVMRTADARTGRAVATPPALRGVRGGLAPVTDGESVVYAADGWMSLWWSPSLQVAPRRVFTSSSGNHVENWVHLVGHYVSFTVWPKAFLADTSSGRYVQISSGGETVLGTKSLALMRPAKTKSSYPHNKIVLLPLRSLPPIPPCR
jgi:hypothetical protein